MGNSNHRAQTILNITAVTKNFLKEKIEYQMVSLITLRADLNVFCAFDAFLQTDKKEGTTSVMI